MSPSREESPCNKTVCHVESRKSLPKTKMDGRYPHRVVRFHSRIGFISHERELLLHEEPTRTKLCNNAHAHSIGQHRIYRIFLNVLWFQGVFATEP